MRLMAGRVVAAAGDLPVHVATDDAEVAAWAEDLGAAVVTVGRPGLSNCGPPQPWTASPPRASSVPWWPTPTWP